MTITEIQKKILTDDDFVLDQIAQLRYLYGLKRVIRSHLTREPVDQSESVAEHVYGMLVLADYFNTLNAHESQLDMSKVVKLITYHDIGEIETGDISTNHKTDSDRERERQAFPTTLNNSPDVLRPIIQAANDEYEAQETLEAKFVKAIDKLEPVIQFCDESHRPLFEHLQFTQEDLHRTKKRYIEIFPLIYRFYVVLDAEYTKRGYYYRSS